MSDMRRMPTGQVLECPECHSWDAEIVVNVSRRLVLSKDKPLRYEDVTHALSTCTCTNCEHRGTASSFKTD